ncbi:hypothetical protein KDAU_18100 [Dictyobacter aurantiacus]|uniref:Protein-glutamine gamma-glutamyltransferase-like C-terminal domain-containing protein n=2 Tax=Dictyobacter aurantiacus TaxID=1936993 RepID=A0A401ZC52_9CHLR|nr:hypothetical protein KDAU_18100 [Dictyobacter aurantiacus]
MGALLIGLARVHFLGLNQPFAPLWAPFLLMIISSWCTLILPDQLLKNNGKTTARGNSGNLVLVFQSIGILCVVWGTFYAGTNALWNPAWLMALLSDLLLFNPTAFAVIGLIIASYALCYHGIRIARYALEPSETLRGIIIGSVIFVAICLLPAIGNGDQADLLLLVLLFFSLALLTRALSYAIFTRQDHITGLQGSKLMQDRLILSTVGIICLMLAVVGLTLGIIINPTLLAAIQQFLSPLGRIYDGATYAIAWLMAFMISWIPLEKFKFTPPKLNKHAPPPAIHPKTGAAPPQAVQTIASFIFIALLIALLVAVIILVVVLLRRRRAGRRSLDLHESLWSWELFWQQIKGLLSHLWQGLMRRKDEQSAPIVERKTEEDEMPVLRDVRAIYRAFLQWAASQGYRRQQAETPGEFKQRLVQPLPVFEPEVQAVTEIYTAARYSHVPPGEAEVARMQQNWSALQQKSAGSEQQ